MAWKADPIKHFLEVIHIGDEGKESSETQEFTPEEYSTIIPLHLSRHDTELRARPYTLEHLKQLVEEDYENEVVNELFVGIRDKTRIAYVGKFWTSKQFDNKRREQYFFDNDEPRAFNFGLISGPGWPLNRPPVLDEKLMKYFTALKYVRPNVAGSLDRCIKHLIRARPEYTGKSDGCISLELAKK